MDLAPGQGRGFRARLVRFANGIPFWIWIVGAALVGGIIGLGSFTLSYAEGLSYLTNDPNACNNCHVMRDYYDGWNRSSHHAVAVCNDCHAPHDSLAAKYAVKGINGLRHSYAFTTGDFPDPIRITRLNRRVAEHSCLYCHGDLTSSINHAASAEPTDCIKCHAGVGHGK